jgi:hypothetical protein
MTRGPWTEANTTTASVTIYGATSRIENVPWDERADEEFGRFFFEQLRLVEEEAERRRGES